MNRFVQQVVVCTFWYTKFRNPYLLILGHTNCGAVRVALGDYRVFDTQIQSEVVGILECIRFIEYFKINWKIFKYFRYIRVMIQELIFIVKLMLIIKLKY